MTKNFPCEAPSLASYVGPKDSPKQERRPNDDSLKLHTLAKRGSIQNFVMASLPCKKK